MSEQAGHSEFVDLVQEHRGMLHKVCNLYCSSRADRQDLFQEIVVQLWRSWPGFRHQAKFSTWLYRIALNTAITGLRKRRAEIRTVDPVTLPAGMRDQPYDGEPEEQLDKMYAAIGKLTELERALVMLYLENKSYEEMQEIMGIRENNLRVKMSRIKEKLRKLTQEEHGTR